MKKLLLGSIALTLFSVSILLFQISCKKEVTAAQEPASAGGVNQLGVILFEKTFTGTLTPKKQREIWIANIDGTNARKIPVNIPSDIGFYDAKLSPNGKTIVFWGELRTNYSNNAIYSFSIDGTGLKRILAFDSEIIDDKNYPSINLCSVN